MGVSICDRIGNGEIQRRAGIEETLAEKVVDEYHDDFATLKEWMRGTGQERSRQLKWKAWVRLVR